MKTNISPFSFAQTYYTILFEVNQMHLEKRQIELVAFCAINGTISSPPVKAAFISQFKSSKGGVNNIISDLQKLGILVKDEYKKIRLAPSIRMDFTGTTGLSVKMKLIKEND